MSSDSNSSSDTDSAPASRSASPTISTRDRSVSASLSRSVRKTAKWTRISFNSEERKYLTAIVPQYVEYCDTSESHGKGAKKDWIIKQAVRPFTKAFKRFKNYEALGVKIERFFYNKTGSRSKVSRPRIAPKKSQKPRKTNPKTLFARDHDEEIKAEKATLESVPHGLQLDQHNKILNKMWEDLEQEQRQVYIDRGLAIDGKRREAPSAEEIDENQRNLPAKVLDLLNGLAGYEWGESGDFAFFVLGAYKNSLRGKNVKVFSLSGGTKKASTFAFSDHPDYDYEQSTKLPFAAWASDVLSNKRKVATASRDSPLRLQLAYDDDDLPLLPALPDIDSILPQQVRNLLVDYLEATWECELRRVSENIGKSLVAPVPWDDLNSKKGDSLLVDAGVLRGFVGKKASLNPRLCSDETAVKMLEFIVEGQKIGKRALEFLLTESTIAQILGKTDVAPSDSEIEEVAVEPVTPRKRKRDEFGTQTPQPAANRSDIKRASTIESAHAATKSADKEPVPEPMANRTAHVSDSGPAKSTSDKPTPKKSKAVAQVSNGGGTAKPAIGGGKPALKKTKYVSPTKPTNKEPAPKKTKHVTQDSNAGPTDSSTNKELGKKGKKTIGKKGKKAVSGEVPIVSASGGAEPHVPPATGGSDIIPAPKRQRVVKTYAPREASRRIHNPEYSNTLVNVRKRDA